MIAIHSALYIFKSKSGEGGLYPYRRLAYAVWFLYPITMAALAFINGHDAYTNEGTYCYLPVRPLWYTLALTWVPRYIIFLIILGIYASIYFYVRYRFHGFAKTSKIRVDSTNGSSGEHGERLPKADRPSTPPLARHGLIPEPGENTIEREPSLSTMEIMDGSSPLSPTMSAHLFIWGNLISSSSQSSPERSLPEPVLETGPISTPISPQAVPQFPPPAVVPAANSVGLSWDGLGLQRSTLNSHSSPSPRGSQADMLTVLAQPSKDTANPSPLSQLHLTNSQGQDLTLVDILRTRDKIRRQLRFLFIYPLVYMGMWILPFASHILDYDTKYAVKPLFGLNCITTICVCSQAAVDCWLFSTREKPWRHIPGTDNSFCRSLRFWTGWKGVTKRRRSQGPGKTRDEMAREAKAAYRRRDEEMAYRRTEVSQQMLDSTARGERSWWEAAGLDGPGGMSPMPEEHINPLDNIIIMESPMPQGETVLEHVDTSYPKEQVRGEHPAPHLRKST
jgi:G protein-coupled receptor GPR1